MPIASGATIGPYKVDREIGRGGMGVIFLAHDTRLGRTVALKALPDDVASDQDRLQRFEREARVLASLSHPHIGAIYGFEHTGEMQGLVLELIEGPTLADRIAAGPLALREGGAGHRARNGGRRGGAARVAHEAPTRDPRPIARHAFPAHPVPLSPG